MNWVTNLKIGRRLAAGFGITLLLVALMAILSILQSKRIYTGTEEIANSWLPSVQSVGDLRIAASTARSATLRYVLSEPGPERSTWEATYVKALEQFAKTRKIYEATISSKEERDLVNEMDAAWSEFTEANAPLMKQGATGADIRVLRDIAAGDSGKAYLRASKALAKDVELNRTGAETASAHAASAYRTTLTTTLALAVVALVTGCVVALIIARSIVVPIRRAVAVADTVASGDLTTRIDATGKDETADLLRALQAMSNRLASLVGAVRESSESIATGSSQIAAGNTDLSQRTEEQAAALEETAASMDQLTATVKQNADNAKLGNNLAQDASTVATKGGAVVDRVIITMQDIQSSSEKVSDIISVIEAIAFQTNILALNAAVEAARAGEQGRGFAVVAGEVRTLAQRSASAAKEIKDLIGQSVSAVGEGSALVNEAGVTMREVVRSVAKVTDLMGEISAASTEQHTGIEQVNRAIGQMDEVTQQNAALVEQASAAAQSMAAQSTSLKALMTTFRLTHA